MTDSMPQLPEYDPHPDLWSRIEADLLADEQLSRTLSDLPIYTPEATLWVAIEQDLNTITKVQPIWTKFITQSVWVRLVAAALIVLIGSWLFLRSRPTEVVRVEYAVEQTYPLPEKTANGFTNQSATEKRAEEFIARQCIEQQLGCQLPEVHNLRNQLSSLIAEQHRIEREQQIFGNDPALVRAQVKIENQRAEVTKELITLLRS